MLNFTTLASAFGEFPPGWRTWISCYRRNLGDEQALNRTESLKFVAAEFVAAECEESVKTGAAGALALLPDTQQWRMSVAD
jgi:hypothetical protein